MTPVPVDVEDHTAPHFKAGINSHVYLLRLERGSVSILDQSFGKMGCKGMGSCQRLCAQAMIYSQKSGCAKPGFLLLMTQIWLRTLAY
jgi:hypothetical protein